MPLDQENKNGNAPLGSIKDRIKSFEVMKESGTTSPRARSPITALAADNRKTIRRTINWERDSTERKQIRRSERREAELRRENGMTQAMKTTSDSSDEKKSTRPNAGSGVSEKRPPLVAPKLKEKPPDVLLRKKIQEHRDTRMTMGNMQESGVEISAPSPENLVSSRTTESSSNESIDLNTSDDVVDMSSEDTEEKEHQENVEEGNKEEAREEEKDDEDEEMEKEDEEKIEYEVEEDEEVEKDEEVKEGKDEGKEGKEEDEEEEKVKVEEVDVEQQQKEKEKEEEEGEEEENEQDEQEEEQEQGEEDEGEEEDGEEEDEEEEDDGDDEELEDEEEDKIEKQDENGDDDGGSKTEEFDMGDRRESLKHSHDKTANDNCAKQPKRLGSEHEEQRGREETDKIMTHTEDNLSERSEHVGGKSKNIEESYNHGNKTKGKAGRRKSNGNSIKSTHEKSLDETNMQLDRKSEENKTKPPSRNEENDTSSGDEDIPNQAENGYGEEQTVVQQIDTEISTSSQLSIYSSNVLGMLSVNIPKSENEGVRSTDGINMHKDRPTKKAFVCPIHEENCKYYCQDCERLICSECAMRWGDCHEHYYLRVKDAWKKYREEMMKMLQEAKLNVSRIQDDILDNSKARDSFKLKVDSTVKKINSFFDEHVQTLEKRRTSFLETVEEILKFREIGINQEIECLQNNLVETSGTINIAGRVYGSSTMMEFLQVCKQLSHHLSELGQKKMKAHLMDNVDIDFISEPSLYEKIEKLGQLKKHSLSVAPSFGQTEGSITGLTSENKSERESKLEESTERRVTTDSDMKLGNPRKVDFVADDSIDTSIGTSTENESTSAKDTNNIPRKEVPLLNSSELHESVRPEQGMKNVERKPTGENGIIVNSLASQSLYKNNDETKEEHVKLRDEEQYERGEKLHKGTNLEQERNGTKRNEELRTISSISEENIEACFCRNGIEYEKLDNRNGLPSDSLMGEKVVPGLTSTTEKAPSGQQYIRRHSMDDAIGSSSKKDEIQRRLGNIGRLKPQKRGQFMDEGERYFSSGEAEQRRRKQEYYKVRFNDRAYYSNPSDSSELEEMRSYNLEDNNRPIRQKVRRHRTMPLIRPISERQQDKSPWSLDVFHYHGKIHFSRNSLKATGKAFGWNAVIGSQAFSQGRHSWKVRVTKWTAVGVCYQDDHINNPSWGAGNKWTWDSADMCFSPRLGVCESPVGEWIDGDVIALELDCDNSVLIVHNLRTSESDKLFGFKEPVYPYFYLSVFRSISLIEIDGVHVE